MLAFAPPPPACAAAAGLVAGDGSAGDAAAVGLKGTGVAVGPAAIGAAAMVGVDATTAALGVEATGAVSEHVQPENVRSAIGTTRTARTTN